MKQIFLLGASSVYGVGGTNGGWGELLKQYLHEKMYGENGVGEIYEIYNFAKSGATTQFVLDTFPEQIRQYWRGGDAYIVVGVGGNNSKATGTPDNFVSTADQYIMEMSRLFDQLAKYGKVIFVQNGWVDETKTNPKMNPFDGTKSYFTNARRVEFNKALKPLCAKMGVVYIEPDLSPEAWQANYLYVDGLHPNDAGHQLIFELVCAAIPTENTI